MGVAPPPAYELGKEARVARDVLQTFGQGVGAVEVPAQPDVVRARELLRVLDVVGDDAERHLRRRVLRVPLLFDASLLLGVGDARGQRLQVLSRPLACVGHLLRHEAGHEGDHDDAAVLRELREHRVGHVARHVAERARRTSGRR